MRKYILERTLFFFFKTLSTLTLSVIEAKNVKHVFPSIRGCTATPDRFHVHVCVFLLSVIPDPAPKFL